MILLFVMLQAMYIYISTVCMHGKYNAIHKTAYKTIGYNLHMECIALYNAINNNYQLRVNMNSK